METELFNKELIHGSKKKMKWKNKDNVVNESLFNKKNQQSDNEDKIKSKSRKRKRYENENHEKKCNDESHTIKMTKEIDMDVKKDCGGNIKKIKKKQKHENNKKYKSCVPNYIQPEDLKKKKKKKRKKKLNLEDYDEKCKVYDDIKYKKYKEKKVRKKDIENSSTEIRIENENFEEDCIQDEPTVPGETNSKSIHSLYSHESTNDPNRFNSTNDIAGSVKKKYNERSQTYDDYLYKPQFIEENLFGEIENIPEKDSYWSRHNLKYDVDNYPQEVIQREVIKRVEYIADYFDRFSNDSLTEEECLEKELSNFNGPYLPTPQHIKFFSDLNIELDWEIPEEQQLLFSYYPNKLQPLKKSGLHFVTYNFIRSEDTIILENWQKFKEQYKFYDLRPLIGLRTMKVNREEECFKFESVDYIEPNERHKFLLYMARGLEKRAKFQVEYRINAIALRIKDNEISYENTHVEPKEVAEIEAFIKLFGAQFQGMEFILGRVGRLQYAVFSNNYIKYKNIPIRAGQWQSTEKCRFLRALFKATDTSSLHELLNSKISWKKVFPLMKTRLRMHCQAYYIAGFKKVLELASYVNNQNEIESANIIWTSNDYVKLVKLVSENLGPTFEEIDWEEVSSHFEVFGPNYCKRRFQAIYYKSVPRNKRSSLKEGVDYLLTYAIPQLEKGLIKFYKESCTLDQLRSLPIKKDQSANTSVKWSLKNKIKLIKEVYENAGSSVETTNWSEISSHFKKYDERDCRNHFRYLYFNRVPHEHRASFDSALEYLNNCICPMLKQKKKRNRREFNLTEKVVNLSTKEHHVLQALINDINQADDDEDIAMLLEENNEQLKGQHSQSTSFDSHAISATQKIPKK